MKPILFCFILIQLWNNIEHVDANFSCPGENWIAYKDEKCFKLIKTFTNGNQARTLCQGEKLHDDQLAPTLASIHSAEEQEFLNNFIFKTNKLQSNVWIGLKQVHNVTSYAWDDGTEYDFKNWANGHPLAHIGRDCVIMESAEADFALGDSEEGKWKDVTCELANNVLCEKKQTWSLEQMQKEFLDYRKMQLENPVPIGFIYVQLPEQPEPSELWKFVKKWEDVSSDYAGLFFRVLGGGSNSFGYTQEESFPHITQCHTYDSDEHDKWSVDDDNLIVGSWSEGIKTGGYFGSNVLLRFYTKSDSVIPRNKAVKIWKRTQ